ncbi:MAG: helix-turn-helix transcriptional regulator [Clostridia bacterium]|nr:helix-turn-helix transcriptional regulator [Clostridia bacterium]
MNKDFPRIITLLREERGFSQKKAADALGISQPLLSHYEKGIRECSLDFVVRVAYFYDVSCDYLLGRTPNRSNGKIVISDIPENDMSDFSYGNKMNVLTSLNKKLIINTLNIVFDQAEKLSSSALIKEISSCLMLSLYTMFRLLYSSNSKNPEGIFSIPAHLWKSKLFAKRMITENNVENLLNRLPVAEYKGIDRTRQVELSPTIIEEQYSAMSDSLLNLIQIVEKQIEN